MSKKPTQKQTQEYINDLHAKIQYLVDFTSVDNPDGCFTFPDGDRWDVSEKAKKEYREHLERMNKHNPDFDPDGYLYLKKKIDKDLKVVYDAVNFRPQLQYDESGEPYAEYDDER